MFDDGYDDLCQTIVSLFETDPSNKKLDADTYCGCVDHLDKSAAGQASAKSDSVDVVRA